MTACSDPGIVFTTKSRSGSNSDESDEENHITNTLANRSGIQLTQLIPSGSSSSKVRHGVADHHQHSKTSDQHDDALQEYVREGHMIVDNAVVRMIGGSRSSDEGDSEEDDDEGEGNAAVRKSNNVQQQQQKNKHQNKLYHAASAGGAEVQDESIHDEDYASHELHDIEEGRPLSGGGGGGGASATISATGNGNGNGSSASSRENGNDNNNNNNDNSNDMLPGTHSGNKVSNRITIGTATSASRGKMPGNSNISLV